MPSNRKVLALPGDGIGVEVMRQVYRLVEWFDRKRIASFDLAEDVVGGAAYDAHGTPLTEVRPKRDRTTLAMTPGPDERSAREDKV